MTLRIKAGGVMGLCAVLLIPPAWAGGIGGGFSGESGGAGGGAGNTNGSSSLVSQVTSGTLQGLPRCLNWQPTGVCLWLVCTPFGCTVEESIQYGHFNPDVYLAHDNGRSLAASGGERTEGGPGRPDHTYPNHQNLIFKDVAALSHPLASALYQISSEFFCQSDASAAQPYYFVSAVDSIGWRYGLPDMVDDLDSWIPGRREIGNFPFNTWGAVMPRSGWAIQSDPPKMAAVLAQRAADIFTRSGEPHVYRTLGSGQAEQKYSDDGAQMVWTPPPIEENKNSGGIWQMVGPEAAKECEIFGDNDTTTLTGWGGGKVATDGEYAFVLWRPYKCCEVEGTFIAAVPILGTYPPPGAGKPQKTGSASSGSIFGGGTSTSTTTTSGGTGQ